LRLVIHPQQTHGHAPLRFAVIITAVTASTHVAGSQPLLECPTLHSVSPDTMKLLATLLSSFLIALLRAPLRGSTRLAVLAVSLCSALVSSFAAAPRPNIILLYTDDHGHADLGIHGVVKDIKTPNLDALARSGAVL
jgi:hypothetical protein